MIRSFLLRSSFVAAVAAALLIASPPGAAAQVGTSLGFFPTRLEITDALRGQRYEQTTTLINIKGGDRTFSFVTGGETDGWFTFALPEAPETLITEILAPDGEETAVLVYVRVPEGTANGEYRGVINYRSLPPESTGGGDGGSTSGVIISLEQPVTVSVTGTQILDVQFQDIFALDVEVGGRLRVQVSLSNRGNVTVTPFIEFDIFTSAGISVATLENRFEPYKAGESKLLDALEWDTTGQQPGDYTANYRITAQGEEVQTGVFAFTILPVGSLERSGEIQSIVFEGSLAAGSIGRADIVFLNSGAADVQARFVGDLYLDGELIATLENRLGDVLVAPGREVTLNVFFNIEQEGEYELRGRVGFAGTATEEASASFEAGGEGGASGGNGSSDTAVLAGGAAAAAVLIFLLGGFGWRRMRRRGA